MPSSTRLVTPDSAASTDSGSSVGRPRPSESPSHMPGKPAASVRRARSAIRSVNPPSGNPPSGNPLSGSAAGLIRSIVLTRMVRLLPKLLNYRPACVPGAGE